MERQDVREIDTWVFADYNHNILFEGPFDETSKFSKNAPAGILMSKRLFETYNKNNGG